MRMQRSLVWWLPVVVGLVSLLITGWLWWHEQRIVQRVLRADFDVSVRQTASRIEARMASYEQVLRGAQGLLLTAGPLRREQFDGYVDTLLAGADFAGIQYLGYAERRAGAGADPASIAIVFAAPATGLNLKVIGDNPYADPQRRAAMQVAADSGGVAITPRLADLIAGEPAAPAGLLMFLPVYARGQPTDSVAARRAALSGWVVVGVRMHDLMSSLYGEGVPGIEVSIYDGVDVDRGNLMYESSPGGPTHRLPDFDALEYIGMAGHTWTLAVSARPDFAQRGGGDSARIIVGSGIGLSLLLAMLMHQLVSGRQKADTVASTATSELLASEERYRRIVETADEGIWMTDAQGRTTFVNPKLTQMLGGSRAALLGRARSDFLADGAATGEGPRELRLKRLDGTLLWASMTTTPIVDSAGTPAGALAMLTDISAKKQADAARFELEAQLRESQKMEAIGTLAGGIAHDFNNVLAVILGNVALVREHLPPTGGGHTELELIGHAAGRARGLVQQILAFSRKQPHRLVVQPLRPLVEESARLLRPLLPALARLELVLPDAPLNVAADATQIQQVLMNLCTNAWHALEGQAGCIEVGLHRDSLDAEAARRLGLAAGTYARLWVSDTGCGMDEATRARVFEPFFTTKPVGQGTGLGLSVVHGIVATHGGAIAVASRPGEGSRFDLLLPLLSEPRTDAPAAVSPVLPARMTSGRHVAYVDDDPVILAMVRALLSRSGYRVTSFEDPREAIAVLARGLDDFDVLVTDYNMPGCSGLDLAHHLRQTRPELPVVISSGFVSEEVLARAAEAGVRHVLQKEYTLERLAAVISAVLAEPPVDRAALPPETPATH